MGLEKSVQLLWASISIRCLDGACSLSVSLSLSNLLSPTEVTKGNNGRSIVLEGINLASKRMIKGRSLFLSFAYMFFPFLLPNGPR